jgi:hypothetical protein
MRASDRKARVDDAFVADIRDRSRRRDIRATTTLTTYAATLTPVACTC